MVEMCKLTHGKGNLMGQQVPAPWGKILRLGFYFTALPEGWETGRKTRKKHFPSEREGEEKASGDDEALPVSSAQK